MGLGLVENVSFGVTEVELFGASTKVINMSMGDNYPTNDNNGLLSWAAILYPGWNITGLQLTFSKKIRFSS